MLENGPFHGVKFIDSGILPVSSETIFNPLLTSLPKMFHSFLTFFVKDICQKANSVEYWVPGCHPQVAHFHSCSYQPWEVGTVGVPISQMSKLKHQEANHLSKVT